MGRYSFILALTLAAPLASAGLPPYRPSANELHEAYRRADSIRQLYTGKVTNLRLEPHWYAGDHRFWYETDGPGGDRDWMTVDTSSGTPSPLFDRARLAAVLGPKLSNRPNDLGTHLPIEALRLQDDGTLQMNVGGKGYACDLKTYELKDAPLITASRRNRPAPWTQNLWPAEGTALASPDGAWSARCAGNNVQIKPKDGQEFALTNDGTPEHYYARLIWRADSKKLVAVRVAPGDRKQVYLIQSSPPGGGRALLRSRVYDQAGDKVDAFDFVILDPAEKRSTPVAMDPVQDFYFGMPEPRWTNDKTHFTFSDLDRGYQRWRLFDVDTNDGSAKALIDNRSKTNIDAPQLYFRILDSGEVIYRSDQDGWSQLYLYSPAGALENRITNGQWVVRGVDYVDEKGRTLVFRACGVHLGEDPYFIHYFRVNLDGTGLTELTPEPGDHAGQLSPDHTVLIDTSSSASNPPVHRLRRVADGALLSTLSTADDSALVKAGWRAPEVFVAKARDGKTDIWGMVYRPSHFDPRRSYPVIEDIYAGPENSYTPKDFAPWRSDQSMAELGFIVVKMDGMGTSNRSKAFEDVCWKNLADAGFPDRILWIKALAEKYHYIDLNRVGIFGTSAGGQESTAAMLFHPEFYKVAVSSCGCHDNRMDKLWWNEQHMGYPVGPEYADQSNITNASKLQGKLLLFVGELDTNVPPESTFRLVNALILAKKNFDMLVIPNSDHTDGGPYGEHKRRDYFVHNLLGVEPPDWNQ